MPEGKGGDDLNVFEDLLKKKEQERAPSQPNLPPPEPSASPPSWFGKPADAPAATEAAPAASEPPKKGPESVSPILAPTEPVDDGGWDDGPSEKAAPKAAAKDEPPAAAPAASSLDSLVPAGRSSKGPAVPAVRLSGVPLPPPGSQAVPPPPSRTSALPKLAPPPTLGSGGPSASSLAPGSLAPPVLTDAAFTSPAAPLPAPPPPSRRSVASQPAVRATPPADAAPRPIVSKQVLVIAATLVAGVAVGFLVRGSGGSSGSSTATLKAAAGQPGVKLLIDGREVGTLPREVSGITPGEHLVAFEGDRYAPAKKPVIFGPSEVKELEPERLKVVRGAATFDVKTPGASLALVSPDERRELADYSVPIEVDATKTWTLEASKPGYETLHMPVMFGDQVAKTFTVMLGESQKHDNAATAPAVAPQAVPPEPPKAQPPTSSPEATKVAESTPAIHKASQPEETKAESAKAQTPAGSCKLNINSIPVSKVLLDGRPIGLTPKVGVVVPAGPHTIVFVGENGRKSTSSTCQSGETKAVSTHL